LECSRWNEERLRVCNQRRHGRSSTANQNRWTPLFFPKESSWFLCFLVFLLQRLFLDCGVDEHYAERGWNECVKRNNTLWGDLFIFNENLRPDKSRWIWTVQMVHSWSWWRWTIKIESDTRVDLRVRAKCFWNPKDLVLPRCGGLRKQVAQFYRILFNLKKQRPLFWTSLLPVEAVFPCFEQIIEKVCASFEKSYLQMACKFKICWTQVKIFIVWAHCFEKPYLQMVCKKQ